jgi:hypothetical protein
VNSWIETVLVLFIAAAGVGIGVKISRTKGYFWLLGCLVPLIVLSILAAVRFYQSLIFIPPFSYFLAGRVRFVILALAVTVGLMTPLSRLRHLYQRVVISVLMAVVVIWFAVLPFLMPVLIKEKLLNLPTMISADGVCFQSTDYTCAPAAAVTALGRLGIKAQEGQLALLSYSNPITGTLPVCLENALQSSYGSSGLECRFRHFDSVRQMKDADSTLAIVRSSLLSDHCVAILSVTDDSVLFADPSFGMMQMTYSQFEKIWRFAGITIKSNSAGRI